MFCIVIITIVFLKKEERILRESTISNYFYAKVRKNKGKKRSKPINGLLLSSVFIMKRRALASFPTLFSWRVRDGRWSCLRGRFRQLS